MITPSHIIYSWAAAKWLDSRSTASAEPRMTTRRTIPFILGAALPDVAIFVFFIVYYLILGYSGTVMWDELYFHSSWSIAFTLSHSLLLWPLVVLLATWWRNFFWQGLGVSALFHTCVDFFVHSSDAYRHFWPLSDWQFSSPVSYWNPAEYGQWVGLVDQLLVLVLLSYLWTRYPQQKWVRAGLLLLGLVYAGLAIGQFVVFS